MLLPGMFTGMKQRDQLAGERVEGFCFIVLAAITKLTGIGKVSCVIITSF